MALPQPVELYFIFAPGCHACEDSKPAVIAAHQKLGHLVRFEAADLTSTEFPAIGDKQWKPDKTPTFFLRVANRAWVLEGQINEGELEEWILDRLKLAAK